MESVQKHNPIQFAQGPFENEPSKKRAGRVVTIQSQIRRSVGVKDRDERNRRTAAPLPNARL